MTISIFERLELLGTLEMVVDTGSIAEAAKRLAVDKAEIDRRLSRLEEFYGTKLFVRTDENVEITAYGSSLFARLDAVAKQFEIMFPTAR